MRLFYVYEHWRPDTGECFYVGKGKNKRAFEFRDNRNIHYKRVIAKLARLGFIPIVKIIRKKLIEQEAFDLEIKRIAMWKRRRIKLTNATDGGEGRAGPSHRKGKKLTFEHIEKVRLSHIGKIHTAETRRKIGRAFRGRKLTKEHCSNMSKSMKKSWARRHNFIFRKENRI